MGNLQQPGLAQPSCTCLDHGPDVHCADVWGHVMKEEVGVEHAQGAVTRLHRRQQAAGGRQGGKKEDPRCAASTMCPARPASKNLSSNSRKVEK